MRYPILEQQNLSIVPRRGLRKRTRPRGETPEPNAHEILVFRVNGRLLVDNGQWGSSHSNVIKATHVSLVDMSLDAPVVVELALPAADAAEFTVQVTFECEVTEPIVVVRNGRVDARSFLEGHLRSIRGFVEIGHKFRLDQVADMRAELNQWLGVFATEAPISEPGMRIKPVSVEVMMPAELADFERRRRELRRSTTLNAEGSGLVYALARILQDHDHTLRDLKQKHDHTLESNLGNHRLIQLHKQLDAVGHDEVRAAHLALVSGDISSADLAAQLRTAAERDSDRTHHASEQALREHLLALRAWIRRGGADNVNIDPDKLDGLFDRLIDDTVAALDASPAESPLGTPTTGKLDEDETDVD
ncbi:hypothetical protein [Nocardia cyriacigeorgica]|uniref:Uncharacterized protein n=2 Tax=Nocardia cyriacigeorgica TaxID=135487 RepID=A0A6P1D400_9NOCA|nr:hypothetical protein [Nocardia cyriacigeorgica]NEW44748.1 hypothetical protein [Nocardia cyriacigeorgica]